MAPSWHVGRGSLAGRLGRLGRLALLPTLGSALIDVRGRPGAREIPPGQLARWMWQGPFGKVQLNASCLDGSSLDFYVLTGDHAEMRRRQRGQHGKPMKEVPDCEGCQEFSFESALPGVDSNVTMLIASNQAGRFGVQLHFTEILLDVPSCMDQLFLRPYGFAAIALMLAALITVGFYLTKPLCRSPTSTTDDEAWAPQVV